MSQSTAVKKLYLEDLTPGLTVTTGSYAFSEAEIIGFAEKYDPQPFHTDPEAAKASLFQGLAASGWHTAAITMRLLVTHGTLFGDGAIGLGCEISWPKPVRAGDMLQVTSEVLDVRPSQSKPNQGLVTVRSTTLNQHGEPVQIMTSKIIAYRRPL